MITSSPSEAGDGDGAEHPRGTPRSCCHWLCLWDVLQRGCKKRNQIFILFCLLVCFKIRGKVPRGSPQCCCASLAAVVLGGAVRIPVLAPKVPISRPKAPLKVPALAPGCGGIGWCQWGLWFVGDLCGITLISWGLITVFEGPMCYGELEPSNAAAQMSEHG